MATTKGVAVGRRLRRTMDVAVRSSMIINDYYGREGLAGSGSVVIVVGRRCCAVHGIDVRCPMSDVRVSASGRLPIAAAAMVPSSSVNFELSPSQ